MQRINVAIQRAHAAAAVFGTIPADIINLEDIFYLSSYFVARNITYLGLV